MYSVDNTKFSVDWLNVRLSVDNLNQFLDDLCSAMDYVIDVDDILPRESGGVCFYKYGYYIPAAGYSSVVFAYNVDEYGVIINEPGYRTNYGLLVSVSGDGCRYLNSLCVNGLEKFIRFISRYDPHCTRIDLACDFLDKDNKVVPMIQRYGMSAYDREHSTIDLNCDIRRKPGFCQLDMVYDDLLNTYTTNVTVGGRNSTKGTLQLYNKRVEMQTGRLSEIAEKTFSEYGVIDYWWRLEYRCKSFAQGVFDALLKDGIVSAFYNAANGFGAFVEVDDSNLSRCSLSEAWSEFLSWVEQNGVCLVQFVSQPYVPSSVVRTLKWASVNASLVYRVYLLSLVEPDLFQKYLQDGEIKHHSNARYRQFDNDFNNIYSSKLSK